MASIRITRFEGVMPKYSPRLLPHNSAQVAHNCLLTDGSLRPQAKWVKLDEVYTQYESSQSRMRSICYDRNADKALMYNSYGATNLYGEPFAKSVAVGSRIRTSGNVVDLEETFLALHTLGIPNSQTSACIRSTGVSGTVNYTRAYQSNKPVNRVYGVSRVRKNGGRTEEGTICAIIGDPTALVYEGDDALLEINVQPLDDSAGYIRLYRSISGLDTGEALANEQDTHWHLIDEIPTFGSSLVIYSDGGPVVNDPLDVNYSEQFHPLTIIATFFGLTESGWFIAADRSGNIAVSERYMHHAWPPSQVYSIQGVEITSIAIFMDTVFIGTNTTPYVLSLSQGEKGVQGAIVPCSEAYSCCYNSMSPSSYGAVFASNAGLISITREGIQVLSRDYANAGDVFYTKVFPGFPPMFPEERLVSAIGKTNHGRYYNGWYYGFCGPAELEIIAPVGS